MGCGCRLALWVGKTSEIQKCPLPPPSSLETMSLILDGNELLRSPTLLAPEGVPRRESPIQLYQVYCGRRAAPNWTEVVNAKGQAGQEPRTSGRPRPPLRPPGRLCKCLDTNPPHAATHSCLAFLRSASQPASQVFLLEAKSGLFLLGNRVSAVPHQPIEFPLGLLD